MTTVDLMTRLEQIVAPGIGRLQWVAASPHEGQHWYVSTDRRIYRVTVTDGVPVSVHTTAGVWVCDLTSELEMDSLI